MADNPTLADQYFAQAQRQAQNPYNNGMGIGWSTILQHSPLGPTLTAEEVNPNKLLLLEEV